MKKIIHLILTIFVVSNSYAQYQFIDVFNTDTLKYGKNKISYVDKSINRNEKIVLHHFYLKGNKKDTHRQESFATFTKKLIKENLFYDKLNSIERTEKKSIIIKEIKYLPVSYLNNTVFLALRIKYANKNTAYTYKTYQEYIGYNIQTDTIYQSNAIIESLKIKHLKKALKNKWNFIHSNFSEEEWKNITANKFQSESALKDKLNIVKTIENNIQNLDPIKSNFFWTGLGIMVDFPIKQTETVNKPIRFNIHLTAKELNKATLKNGIFKNINKLKKANKDIVNSNPMVHNLIYTNRIYKQRYFNFLTIDDKEVTKLSTSFLQYKRSKKQVSAIYTYKNGKLITKKSPKKGITDSIIWKNKDVYKLYTSFKNGKVASSYGGIFTKIKDKNENVISQIHLNHTPKCIDYLYFENKIVQLQYGFFENFRESLLVHSHSKEKNYWRIGKFNRDIIYKENDNGDIELLDKEIYLYNKKNQLIQHWTERYRTTLYFYDKLGRLDHFRYENSSSPIQNKLIYKDNKLVPHKVLEKHRYDKEWRTYYLDWE